MAFSFSLNDTEFERIKKGPRYGNIEDCPEGRAKQCRDKCLEVADYAIGWARMDKIVLKTIQQSKAILEHLKWVHPTRSKP